MCKQLFEEYLLAQVIYDYLKDRAAVQGVAFDASLGVIFSAVCDNERVFGVLHDRDWMLQDDQEPHPGYFEEYMRKHCEPVEQTGEAQAITE